MKSLGLRARGERFGELASSRFVRISLLAACVACSGEASLDGNEAIGSTSQATSAGAGDVTVTWAETHQTIVGFGAAAVYWAQDITQEQADFFFSQPKGLGLSLVRVSAQSFEEAEDGTLTTVPTYCPELATAKKAQALGARVWAASWTPPPAWKTNGAKNAKPMAHLQPSRYADFAQQLANLATSMAAEGVPLFAISPQNEPDWEADWDGCLWTPQELTTFIRDHLGPKLTAASPMTRIIAPDTASWSRLTSFVTPLMADATARGYVDAIATHPYGSGDLNYTVPRDNNKEFWETEVSQERMPTDTPDPSMTSAITMARMIHDHMTVANMNAWHWWALMNTDDPISDPVRQNPALIQAGVTFKRAYALGNFAKFVRPGMLRITATPSPATDILVSAYRDDMRVSIVAINASSQARMQEFWLNGREFGQVVPWVTSDSLSLAKQTAIPATTNFSYALPAKSVVTFVNWAADVETTGGTGGAGGTGQGGSGPGAGASGLGGSGGSAGSAAGGVTSGAGTGGTGATTGGNVPTSGGGGAGAGAVPSGGGAGPTGSAGAPIAAGAPTQGPAPASDSGCGCRVPAPEGNSAAGSWLALLGIGLARYRRVRRMRRAAARAFEH